MTWKRLLIIGVIAIIGFILGRLAFRAFLNLLMGGTMFGGNILWVKKRKGEKECLFLFVY